MSDWNIGLFGDFHIGLFSCGVCVPCNESKVCLLLPLHSAITTEIIFENVYCRRHYTRKRANAHTKSADTRWSKIICHAELWALRSSTAYQSADLRVWEVWRFIGFAPLNLQTFRSYSTSDSLPAQQFLWGIAECRYSSMLTLRACFACVELTTEAILRIISMSLHHVEVTVCRRFVSLQKWCLRMSTVVGTRRVNAHTKSPYVIAPCRADNVCVSSTCISRLLQITGLFCRISSLL